MFVCPQCNTELWKKRGQKGVFWVCPTCNGRTSTIGMLRKAIPDAAANNIWQTLLNKARTGTRKCPSCHKTMKQVPAPGQDHANIIDICQGCQFIWFDPGEYESLPHEDPPEELVEDLPLEARQRLAEIEVERIRKRYEDDLEMDAQHPDTAWKYIAAVLGLPVETEVQDLARLPLATWIMSLVIVVISMIAFRDLPTAVDIFGLKPAEFHRFGGITLLTSFFLHASWMHLLGNVYFLLIFGDNVEDVLGRWRFLMLLVAAALAGDVLHIAGNLSSTIPCIGASGGISGIMTYYALRFPKARMSMIIWLGYFYPKFIKVPAWVLFTFWVAFQLFGASVSTTGCGVAYLAHLGGALIGLIFWFLTRN